MPDQTTPEIELIPDLTFDEALKAVKDADPAIDEDLAKVAAQCIVDGDIDEDDEPAQLAQVVDPDKMSDADLAAVAREEIKKRRTSKAKSAATKAVKKFTGTSGFGYGTKPKKPKKPKKAKTGFSRIGFSASCADLIKLSAHGKKWERKPEGVLIPGVEIMSLLSKDERPEFKMPGDCDEAWMLRVVDTCAKMAAKGKYPRLLRRHNTPNMPAEVIGKLTNVRWESPWLKADALATEPAAIGKLARGEMPSRSAEFYYSTAYLHGLSLTEGEPGHFEEELSDLALADAAGIEELRQLKAGDKLDSICIAAPIKLADAAGIGDMSAAGRDYQELVTRIQNLESILTRAGLVGAPAPAKDANKQLAALPDALKLAVENESMRVRMWARDEADKLVAAGSPLTRDQIIVKLTEPLTEEGRHERLQRLAAVRNDATSTLPAEQAARGVEAEAKEQFARLKASGVPIEFDEATYLKVAMRRHQRA